MRVDQPIWSKSFSSFVGSASWTFFSTWIISLLAGFFAAPSSSGKSQSTIRRVEIISTVYLQQLGQSDSAGLDRRRAGVVFGQAGDQMSIQSILVLAFVCLLHGKL